MTFHLRLLLSLSMTIMLASNAHAQLDTVIIQKDEPAAFSGLLVPEYQFRQMENESLTNDKYKELLKVSNENAGVSPAVSFAVGFFTGLAAVYVSSLVIKNAK